MPKVRKPGTIPFRHGPKCKRKFNNITKPDTQKQDPDKTVNFRYIPEFEFRKTYPETEVPACEHGPCLPFKIIKNDKPVFYCSFNRNKKFGENCCSKSASNPESLIKSGKWSEKELKEPLKNKIIEPVTEERTQGQYLLSERSLKFIHEKIFKKLKYDTVLCIGMPRLHEYLSVAGVNSVLLDIDDRFEKFHLGNFFKFNMFNCHFFDEKPELSTSKKVLVVTDPPYGGNCDAFLDSFSKLKSLFQTSKPTQNLNFSLVWIFPYFFETQICSRNKTLKKFEYVVDYDNHPRFKPELTGRNASTTRMFTDIDRKQIEIKDPLNQFCKKCCFWVLKGAVHCNKCNECFGSVGSLFKHCGKCGVCVKDSWECCKVCQKKCRPPYHKFCENGERNVNCKVENGENCKSGNGKNENGKNGNCKSGKGNKNAKKVRKK